MQNIPTAASEALRAIFNNPVLAHMQRQMEIFHYLEEGENKIIYPSTVAKSPYKFSESFHKNNQTSNTDLDTLRNAGILVERITSKPSTLSPTIANFDEGKVLDFIKKGESGEEGRPIVISRDQYVLDGHHRWLAHYNMGDKPLTCDMVNLNCADILKTLTGSDQRQETVGEPNTPKATDAQNVEQNSNPGLHEELLILKCAQHGLEQGLSEEALPKFVAGLMGVSEAEVSALLEAIVISSNGQKRNFRRKSAPKVVHASQVRRIFREGEQIDEATQKKTPKVEEAEWIHPFKILQKITRSSTPDKVTFKDGKTFRVDVKTAHAITHIHKHLSDANKKKIENGVQKNARSFNKIREWAMAHTTALRESEELPQPIQEASFLKLKRKKATKVKDDHISGKIGEDGKRIESEDEMDIDQSGLQKPVLVNPGLYQGGTVHPALGV